MLNLITCPNVITSKVPGGHASGAAFGPPQASSVNACPTKHSDPQPRQRLPRPERGVGGGCFLGARSRDRAAGACACVRVCTCVCMCVRVCVGRGSGRLLGRGGFERASRPRGPEAGLPRLGRLAKPLAQPPPTSTLAHDCVSPPGKPSVDPGPCFLSIPESKTD